VPIREIRGFDEAKVRVGEGTDANTRGRVCSPEAGPTDRLPLISVPKSGGFNFPVLPVPSVP